MADKITIKIGRDGKVNIDLHLANDPSRRRCRAQAMLLRSFCEKIGLSLDIEQDLPREVKEAEESHVSERQKV